ncbi:WXG100 family type VII secretion target [Actinoalloteichus hymeniacidonis]|uniref:ESAT-6-like protein n=1 Tax=Actinoalloteichus hymeniacidonis TaxID=340345 RepID=A0AAC9HWI0_9PSEU|nr:WXG100 family type VII secretion target [Actinoalloteichus hymeniacidonis]AOS65765.1 WXG100 family type VII secretion target [Actinoalloteichus hymeniacidonis]MBB5906145.1 WXG100 family type VII secretion target [Actinoalloteichus hymeniacidonis]
MSDAFGVTTDEMMAAAGDVATANEEITAVLSSLQSTVGNVAGLWAGAAATQFNTLMESLDAAGQKINAALDEIGQNLAGSGEEYARIEEEQASSIGGIGGRLEGL